MRKNQSVFTPFRKQSFAGQVLANHLLSQGFVLLAGIFVLGVLSFLFASSAHAITRPSVTINGGARSTDTERVNLSFVLPKKAERMRIANSRRELTSATWRTARERLNGWYLPKRNGHQYVYVDFELRDGSHDGQYFDSIYVNIKDFDGEQIVINNGDVATESRRVRLNIAIPDGALRMRISNDVDIVEAGWQRPENEWFWTLDRGSGKRTVYLQFQYRDGRLSNIFQDDIRLIEPIQTQVSASINRGFGKTYTRDVVVSLSYTHGIKEVRLGNTKNFNGVKWQPPQHLIPWKLTDGGGQKVVYAQFKDLNDKVKTVTAKIAYEEPRSTGTGPSGESGLSPYSLVKGPGPGVYYVGEDRTLHPFINSKIFYSWYTNFSSLQFISGVALAKHKIGSPVCVRGGTWLVKFGNLPEIYAVEQGCNLVPLRSEVEAFLVYGRDWQKRIITLPATGQHHYHFASWSVADDFFGKVDADADGLDRETEKSIGTSDTQKDTDGDKVSDYEEFYWWFSDPTVFDTDNDGVGDGDELLQLRQPVGDGAIHTIAEGTYFYPRSSVFLHSNRRYYFHAIPEGPLYMGWRETDKRFTSNSFQERFVINAPAVIPFNTRVRSLATDVKAIEHPSRWLDGKVIPL